MKVNLLFYSIIISQNSSLAPKWDRNVLFNPFLSSVAITEVQSLIMSLSTDAVSITLRVFLSVLGLLLLLFGHCVILGDRELMSLYYVHVPDKAMHANIALNEYYKSFWNIHSLITPNIHKWATDDDDESQYIKTAVFKNCLNMQIWHYLIKHAHICLYFQIRSLNIG